MQGTLNEIDLRSLLQLIELGQRTGELLIEVLPNSPQSDSPQSNPFQHQYWFLFFINGKLAYAADQTCDRLDRLQAYVYHYGVQIPLAEIKLESLALNNIPEYACLWQLLTKNLLTPLQAHRILQGMIKEVLFDLLSLRVGNFIFELGIQLEPTLTTFPVTPLLAAVSRQIRVWKQLHFQLQSPDQQVAISSNEVLTAKLPARFVQRFHQWTKAEISLRQIARYLQKDLHAVAHGL